MSAAIQQTYLFLEDQQYSPKIQKRAKDALVSIFQSHIPNFVLSAETVLKIHGHTVDVSPTEKLEFVPGSKKVRVISRSAQTFEIDGKEAVEVRKAIKELQEHARDLIKICMSSETQPDALPPLSHPTGDAIKTIASPVANSVGVLRNALSLLKIFSFLGVLISLCDKTSWIGPVVAYLRIFQGCLALLLGSIKFYQAYQAFQRAKETHDIEGMEIAKRQMRYQLIVIAEGLLWLTIGSVYLACGATCPAFLPLQWVLFYGGFVLDSAVTIWMNNKNMQSLENHYRAFKEGVLENKNLTDSDKCMAAARFVRRMMKVTPEEERKIREKNPADFEKRLQQKITKKRLIAERLGLTGGFLKKVEEIDPTCALQEIQKAFNRSMAGEKASKRLAILCLIVNFTGLQLDLTDIAGVLGLTDISESLKALFFGLSPDIWARLNDLLWVVVNTLYLFEDFGIITGSVEKTFG